MTPDRQDALFVDRLTVRGTRTRTDPETDKYHLINYPVVRGTRTRTNPETDKYHLSKQSYR